MIGCCYYPEHEKQYVRYDGKEYAAENYCELLAVEKGEAVGFEGFISTERICFSQRSARPRGAAC